MGKISIIGTGLGTGEYMLPDARKRISTADLIVGAPKLAESYMDTGKEVLILESNWREAAGIIAEKGLTNSVAVLVSGDPTLYSFTSMLLRTLPVGIDVDIVPGISSFQYLTAKTGIQWNDGAVVSFHGKTSIREPGQEDAERLLALCGLLDRIIIFTDRHNSPGEVCSFLRDKGEHSWQVTIGCGLGMPDEYITSLPLAKCAENWKDTGQLCVMILEKQ